MKINSFKLPTRLFRTTGIDDVHDVGASLSLNYKPVGWLVIQPFYNYRYSAYRTPNRSVDHSLHNAGIGVQFLPGKWQLTWNGNFPMTSVDGDTYTHYGLNMTVSVLYKVRSMSVGLEYAHNPDPRRVYAGIGGFSYSKETKWNNFRNLVSVKFTYYFSKGQSRGHAGKRITNSDMDSGLTNSNTAK